MLTLEKWMWENDDRKTTGNFEGDEKNTSTAVPLEHSFYFLLLLTLGAIQKPRRRKIGIFFDPPPPT